LHRKVVPAMDVRRALADLAEVRGLLATTQRFDGYSGGAAIASGIVAYAAGVVQFATVPQPHGSAQIAVYLAIWLSCLAFALALNYGAILAWRLRNPGSLARAQLRTVGASILPALAAGGVFTLALALRGLDDLLPGTWCATYALGLFASRAMVPREVVYVAVAFGVVGATLLLVHASPLAWWVMPLAFGSGQISIGVAVMADAETATS